MEGTKIMSNLNEDDEAWLYGGTNEDSIDNQQQLSNENTNSNQDILDYKFGQNIDNGTEFDNNDEDDEVKNLTHKVSSLETHTNENGNDNVDDENNNNNDNDDDDDDDDDDEDDDDNINIVIGAVSKPTLFSGSSPNRQLSKTNQIATTNIVQQQQPKPTVQAKGVDLEAQGTINDVPTLEYDLQGIKDEDKPWRKPGADITDYFNYGFNEETWIAYCMKQRRLRAENATNKLNPTLVNITGAPNLIQPTLTPINIPNTNNTNNIMINQPNVIQNPNFMPKQTGYGRPILQPQRKMGQIDVIGSTDSTSRRPVYELDINMPNQISVLGNNNFQQHPGHVQMPDLSAPPPGWMGPNPPVVRIPHVPIQRMGHPIQIQNYPPYHYGPPNMQQVERPQNYGYMQPYVRNPVPQNNPTWEKPQTIEPYYQDQGSPRSTNRSPTPVKSSSKSPVSEKYSESNVKYKHREHGRGGEYERDHRRSPSPSRRGSYRSHRDRDRDRERDRDYDRREHDRRNEQREKSRSRERSRSRDRSRSKDEKYKRSRRKSDTDDDHRSSRSHKRSKKSRKGRDSNERDRDSKSNNQDTNQGDNLSNNDNKTKSTSDVINKNDS